MEHKATVIDLTYLRDASNNDEGFVKEMIQIFLRQTPVYLDEISLSIKAKDWDTVKKLLHKLKPTLPMMGIAEGEELVKSMETDVKAGNNLSEITTRLAIVKELCERAYVELKELQ